MDNSISDPLPSEHTSNKVSFLDFEGCRINEVDDCQDGAVYHDQYYLEMFRRALKECDQCAQEWLQRRFCAVVLDWVHCHPSRDVACHLHTEEYYAIQAFKGFWQTSLRQREYEFNSMADVLYYLRVSLNGAILDALRSYLRLSETTLIESVVTRESYSNEGGSSHELWKSIEGKLSDARERRLAYLLFHCALKPREIVHRCPQEFSDVREVSRIRRNIIELFMPW
jgi:hypothetical protein